MQYWQHRTILSYLLWPLSLLYCFISGVRKYFYQCNILPQKKFPVPVIVVGNIYVGGTGKTPFTIALVQYLQQCGYNPGIVSRGYKSKTKHYPYFVKEDDDALAVGDEAILLSRHCACPVIIDPRRTRAATALLEKHDIDVIVSDDGLQHYAMARDIEILLIDSQRMFGNGWRLPAGPLREGLKRLNSVNFVVMHGAENKKYSPWHFSLEPYQWVNCKNTQQVLQLDKFSSHTVHAVAAIGNPERFYQSLKTLGLSVIPHSFPDHFVFKADDLSFSNKFPLAMTEKDSVKCLRFAKSDWWYLQIKVKIEQKFFIKLEKCISKIQKKKEKIYANK